MAYRWSIRLLSALALALHAVAAAPADSDTNGGYVGSAACEGCHTYIYDNWRETRHSHSVKTAAEAQQAGYPLPQQRRGGADHGALGWKDIAYVIGGRQRIAYVDSTGRVLDTSFHHRVGRWDIFPTLAMAVCRDCHYTGVDNGAAPAQGGVPPAERNIGCEACHGAGARHVETLERKDIRKDASSRVCGQCHTAVGKILPKGELHATHDLVQHWNQDRHVTAVRHQSHDAFCSTCHSPYDGHRPGPGTGAERRVFSENKENVTCIGCHDPHQLSHPAYRRDRVSLQAPLPIRAHTFIGNDADFTTTDHREWDSAAQSCLGCHRGADRVDLDHADATCIDCHNTFKRNHGIESRQWHDSNRSALSCRGCHDNAEYLMSILYQDPDFLAPGQVHNLRKLPALVQARYGFRYRGLRSAHTIAVPMSSDEAGTAEPASRPAVALAGNAAQTALRELLERESHAALAGGATVQRLREALLEAPGSPAAQLRLAEAYIDLGQQARARELLEFAFTADSSRVLLELPLARDNPGQQPADDARDAATAARVERLLPRSGTAANNRLRQLLFAYLEMARGRFEPARRSLDADASDATTRLYRALAEFGAGDYRRARTRLEANIKAHPRHQASRTALGLLHLIRKRAAPAEAALRQAIEIAPGEPVARLLLGRLYYVNGDAAGAAASFTEAIELQPTLFEARFYLARAYQLGGQLDRAVRVFENMIDLEPELFEARYALANLLKLWSDQILFRLRAEREGSPPDNLTPAAWQARLARWRQRVDELRQRALSELALARQLRPDALDVVRQVAEIYRASQRFDEAGRFYEWLARRQPEAWLHLYRLGTVRYAQGRFDEAIEALSRAIEMAPTDGDARLALGLALARSGRLDEAVSAFEKATTYEPFNPGLYTNLGAAYASRGDATGAQKAFQRSLELHSFPLPRVHLTQTNLALLHLRAGRRDEAVIALRRALHRYPDYALARELLARAAGANDAADEWPDFVYNEWLERFGEVTTVAFANE